MPEPSRRVIKKVSATHGHHGGAWKVAYADFVTAMMALFMVMWLLASTDAASRKEISNYFRTGVMPDGELSMNRAAQIRPSLVPAAMEPPPPGQESFDAKEEAAEEIGSALARIAEGDAELAKMMKAVRISITTDGVLIEAVDDDKGMLFDVASSDLKKPLEHFLKTIAPMIQKTRKPVEINGHTDARRFVPGSKFSNWDLSYQRAAAAREILLEHGVADEAIRGVIARGASQLYDATNPLAPQNRRLSFLIKIEMKPKSADARSLLP